VGNPPLPTDKEAHDKYFHLLEDLHRMEDFEERYPLAMVAFGLARLTNDDRYYILATEIGERLAQKGYFIEDAGVSSRASVLAAYFGWTSGGLIEGRRRIHQVQ